MKLRLPTIQVCLVLVAACAGSDTVPAQDSNRYRVTVPHYMRIDALQPAASATHPGTSADVTLANQIWFAASASPTGATVQLTTDHAFHNVQNDSYRRDARLRLTRLMATRQARWQFDTITDQTNYIAADEVATVQYSSRGPGIAFAWLDVTFLTGDMATLRGGDYQLTVIGTISQN